MKLIGRRARLARAVARLLHRGDPERGDELLGDVRDLFVERRRRRGIAYATLRAGWDLGALAARPRGAGKPSKGSAMTRLLDDLTAAFRSVTRRRGVSVAVAATLSLGMGLSVLAFTLVNSLMLSPLPFPRAHELALLLTEFRAESGYVAPRSAASGIELDDYRRQSAALDIGAWINATASISDGRDTAERLPAGRMTSDAFRVLGVAPVLGTLFTSADDQPGAACAVVLSHGLWRERFGGSASVLSQRVRVDGAPCRVSAVMPEGFAFPNERTRLWLPLAVDAAVDNRGNHGYVAVGRVRPGHTLEDARTEAAVMMERWAREIPHHKGHGLVINSLHRETLGDVRLPLLVLAGASLLVLLVVCANVSNLVLAHAEARRREFALRSAIGARRASIVRQVILEGMLLACAGGMAGGLLAWLGLDGLVAAYPGTLPRASEIGIDLRVLAAAVAACVLIGGVVSLLPAIRLSRAAPSDTLRSGERSAAMSLGLPAQRALVIVELALSTAVTVGAVLLAQSFVKLQQAPLGFSPDDVSVAQVAVPPGDARPAAHVTGFYDALLTRIRAVPGVTAAGAISAIPLATRAPADTFTIEGRPVAAPNAPGFIADYVMTTPGALEALAVPLLAGRMIDEADGPERAPTAVINKTLAEQYWPDASPIGGRIRYPAGVVDGQWSAWGPWITISGVVGDMRTINPGDAARPAIYVSFAQRPRPPYQGREMGVVVRAGASAGVLPQVIRQAAREMDADASVSRTQTLEELVGGALARPRFLGWLMAVFASVALFIAAFGVYAVVAYGVERRRREIGVRMALGATSSSVVAAVGRQALVMLTIGLAAGMAGAYFLTRWLATLLFGVEPFHLPALLTVAVLMTIAVVAAAVVPARRAARVDPLIALRAE